MTFGDFSFEDEEHDDLNKYHIIYEKIKEALSESKILYFDNEDLLDAVEFFLDEEEIEMANDIIDYALIIFPANNDFLLLKSEVFIELAEYDKAFNIIDEIENKEPYLAKIYILRASAYEDMNRDEDALSEYIKALNNNVNDIDLIFEELGYYYLSKKKYHEAAENFKECLEIDTENSAVFDALTNIYLEHLGTLDGLSFFEQYTNKNPDSIYAWYSAAQLFEAEEFFNKAISAYEKVLQMDDTFTNAILNVISCLRKTKNYLRVFKICKHYKDTNYPLFLYEMAETHLDMGDVDEAMLVYKGILKNNDKDVGAIIGLSHCYLIYDEDVKAFNFIESALTENENNIELLLEKAFILKNQDKFKEAIEVYRLISDIDGISETNELSFEIADLYIVMKEIENARTELHKALIIYPNDARLNFALAASYYLLNENEAAYNYFEVAMAIEPDKYDVFFERCENAQNDTLFQDILKKHNI